MSADLNHLRALRLTACFSPLFSVFHLSQVSPAIAYPRYRRFSDPKSRAVDQQFIDLFDLSLVWDQAMDESRGGGGVENLPEWGMLSVPRIVGGRRIALDGASGGRGRAERGCMAGM